MQACVKCGQLFPASEFIKKNGVTTEKCLKCRGCFTKTRPPSLPGLRYCGTCKLHKDINGFLKDKNRGEGLEGICKECRAIKDKEQNKKYRTNNVEKIRGKKAVEYQENKEVIKARSLLWCKNNPEKVKENHSIYYLENKEEICLRVKEWRIDNIDQVRQYSRDYNKERAKVDINFSIMRGLRRRLLSALSGNFKNGSAVRDLGCSIDEFKTYISIFFYNNPKTDEKMTWENRGKFGWHLDHRKPLSSFNLQNREDFLRAVNFTNLQPLWWFDNLEKNDKLDWLHPTGLN